MGIRVRISKPRKLEYHKLFGTVETPPLVDSQLPNGAVVITHRHPKYRSLDIVLGIVIGHISNLNDKTGIWVCNVFAIEHTWQVQRQTKFKLPKGVEFLDTATHLNYVGHIPGAVGGYTTGKTPIEILSSAYEDLHEIYLL